MSRRSCFILLVVAGCLFPIASRGEHLLSPWDYRKIGATDAPYSCPEPPDFSRTLNLESAYIDKKYSILDEQKLAVFNDRSAGPTHLGQDVGVAADAWIASGSRAAARCVYALLASAATANAWDDRMIQNNSVYMQNWLLSGTAIAYLKVRNSGAGTAKQDAAIQHWFKILAERVREYFDGQRKRPGSDAWNNHMYWAGLSVAAEGIATGDVDAFVWGLATFEMGIHAIQSDGSLEAEMARGRMALHYQLYALGPLIMLAELGESNGIDLYGEQDGAIHKLVRFDLAALRDPSVIAKSTGETQKIEAPYSGLEIGWAVPYGQRFPNDELSQIVTKAPWVRFWQWGGAPPDAVLAQVGTSSGATGYSDRLKRKIQTLLAAEFPPGLAHSSFLGEWCGQGRADLHESIANAGDILVLRNEQGSTSGGQLHGPFLLTAAGWGGVSGALTPDGSQIDWSNGTYWARCPSVPQQEPVDLSGDWVAQNGSCSIHQHGDRLDVGGTRDCQGAGRVEKQGHLVMDFGGIELNGLLTEDGNHIDWQDASYWTRANIYRLCK